MSATNPHPRLIAVEFGKGCVVLGELVSSVNEEGTSRESSLAPGVRI
jgi:hypothetical protein